MRHGMAVYCMTSLSWRLLAVGVVISCFLCSLLSNAVAQQLCISRCYVSATRAHVHKSLAWRALHPSFVVKHERATSKDRVQELCSQYV